MGNVLRRKQAGSRQAKGSARPVQYAQPQYQAPQQASFGYSNQSYDNSAALSNMTGWHPSDIDRLRWEFIGYANPYGVIDRDGFRKLFIAALANKSWNEIEHESEAAFRMFDANRTGALDFNEYMTACARMMRDV